MRCFFAVPRQENNLFKSLSVKSPHGGFTARSLGSAQDNCFAHKEYDSPPGIQASDKKMDLPRQDSGQGGGRASGRKHLQHQGGHLSCPGHSRSRGNQTLRPGPSGALGSAVEPLGRKL